MQKKEVAKVENIMNSSYLHSDDYDLGEEDDECVEIEGGSSKVPTRKRPRQKGPLDRFFTPNPEDVIKGKKDGKGGIQQTINAVVRKELRDKACTQIAREHGNIVILTVYVDDIILMGDPPVAAKIKAHPAHSFEMKDLGPLWYFLGIEIARTKSMIILTQRKYTLDLLKDIGMLGSRPASTRMESNPKPDAASTISVNKGRFQRLVGRLIYLAHTRPNITFPDNYVSLIMHSPS
ncbi:uncharacterized protein LOC112518900 [Cynara cardunculus var. scolymus]|uniref:uncharacterized protein LOC112518900 n=1 Tax=Cynara cardunculus var. scolymus TaxID=59895 RepID=UPI000D62456C|nr:uncharacterized protein LOC112518900 [Cynara cardunculus var. scolymus]